MLGKYYKPWRLKMIAIERLHKLARNCSTVGYGYAMDAESIIHLSWEVKKLQTTLDEAASVLESYGRREWHETNLAENMALKIRDILNATSTG
jgi:hypothetical protein